MNAMISKKLDVTQTSYGETFEGAFERLENVTEAEEVTTTGGYKAIKITHQTGADPAPHETQYPVNLFNVVITN